MPQLCPRCQRANPAGAVFCYFDGGVLDTGSVGARAARQLPQEFHFPSGRRCGTYKELVQGCWTDWEDARELLRKGEFARFLGRIGRADLMKAAQEGQSQPDPDVALINFINQLPAGSSHGPKLDITPRRITLRPARVGEQRSVLVTVQNQGVGLLQGKLRIADEAPWLRLRDSEGGQTALHTPREQEIHLVASATGLTAGQAYSTRLVVVSNGGIAEVPVRFDIQAVPFPRSPYHGVETARELAERMRTHPKPAAAMLESGEVARWFQANGWTYPVFGLTAPGVAAVQQFFEGLGLSKPPHLTPPEPEVRLSCQVPAPAGGQIVLRTTARKWVYVHAESDSLWLRVPMPRVSGQQQAVVAFEVDPSQVKEDRLYKGQLRLSANAGQTFTVRVLVEVTGNARGWFARPAAPAPAAPPPVTAAQSLPSWLDGNAAASRSVVAPVPLPLPLPSRSSSGPAVASAPVAVLSHPPPAPVTFGPAPMFVPRPVSRAVPPPPPPAPLRGGPLQALVTGALLGFVVRLALVGPSDLWARLLASSVPEPVPGTLAAWLSSPGSEVAFYRLFVLATWWVGALVGILLVWQRGGRWSDLFFGGLAGAVAGVAGSATLACFQVAVDGIPRLLLHQFPMGAGPQAVALSTFLWCVTAVLCWTLLGAGLGLVLGLGGRGGLRLLAVLTHPLVWLARLFGLGRVARFFGLER